MDLTLDKKVYTKKFKIKLIPISDAEAREPPTSGHKSVMEGPTMVLIVSIGLLYTYT